MNALRMDRKIKPRVSMPYDRHTSPSLVSICSDRPTDSIHIVPYVDTLGCRQCNTEHSSTAGVARNGHVLVTNPNLVTTHASTGSVNPYPNNNHHTTGISLSNREFLFSQ